MARDAEHRDWYVWADPKPDGSPPNNWVSIFGGSAWELDAPSGQYFLHNFEMQQPDLNWWDQHVRDAFDAIVRFWWDRGVAGFRIDVCNMMIKDAELRDNPPATKDDPLDQQLMGVRSVYNSDRPEAHDILRHWRTIADTYDPPRLLIGETNVERLSTLMQFYGNGHDELHGGFNFVFINAALEADVMRAIVEDVEALLPEGAWPLWTGSNHDVSRLATRWGGGDRAKVRCALMILLCLRGTPFLYQGDEIGLTDGPIEQADLRDRVGIRFWPHYKGRDRWSGRRCPGRRGRVADSATTPRSAHGYRWPIPRCAMWPTRRRTPIRFFRSPGGQSHGGAPTRTWLWGRTTRWCRPRDSWVFRRGHRSVVALNMADTATEITGLAGSITLATERGLEGTTVEGPVTLAPWSGIVVES